MRAVALASVVAALTTGGALAEGWPNRPLGFAPVPREASPARPCPWRADCPHRDRWILWPPAPREPVAQPLPTLADARALFDAGRIAAARDLLAELAERMPQDPAVWALLARAERRLGHPAAAAEGVRRALALDPGHPAALAERGFLALAAGQPAQAFAALEALTASCGACAEAIALRSALTGAGYHAGATGPKWLHPAP